MKRFFFTVLSFVVLATVIGISWWELQAQTLESAACIANSACGGDCLVFTKVDESCSSGGRCVAIHCDRGDAGFKYCQSATSGNTCEKSGTIDVSCEACSQWAGDCSNADPDCSEVPTCGDPGGTGLGPFNLKQSCV